MTLLDHFQPPLSTRRHWESFHARWASAISDALNRDLLPKDYFAEVQVHVGSRVEVDIATFQDEGVGDMSGGGGGTATMPARVWAPPAAAMTMPAIFPDSLEVLVYSTEAGPILVGAVELISPGNKDRDEYRRGFAAKCASYLQQGVGLVIVDIVTTRRANLHNELVRLLEAGDEFVLAPESLYAVAYRPIRRVKKEAIEVWPETLQVGAELPVLPLPLDKGLCVGLDLGATYSEACEKGRVPRV